MVTKLDKVKCFLGLHDTVITKIVDNVHKRKSHVMRTNRKCKCCGRITTHMSVTSKWEDHSEYTERVWYSGDYSLVTWLKSTLRSFKQGNQ